MEKSLNQSFNEADRWLLANWSNINDVTAIVFLGRSGSVFLQSLLDNHSQVIMFGGCHLAFYYDFWEKKGETAPNTEILIREFCAYFACFFDAYAYCPLIQGSQPAYEMGLADMGPDRNERAEANREKFISALSVMLANFSKVDRKTFFQAIHVAFTIAINQSEHLDQAKLPIIVHQLHVNCPTMVSKLCSDFPKTKILHMIREPFQTLGSHFKEFGYGCNVMHKFYFNGFPQAGAERSKAIKLEDLHSQPKPTLEKIIQWLGIGWEDSLLESTFNGKKWWNMKNTEQVSGFNKVIISKNHGGFYYKLDNYRFKVLYSKRFKLWGYHSNREISKLERFLLLPLLFIPFKMEVIDWRKNISTRGLGGLKHAIFDWLHRTKRRNYLIAAWKYSLTDEVREVPLL